MYPFLIKKTIVSFILLTQLLLCTDLIMGQINQAPNTINIQGVLNNANGQPVPNGSYSITFRIYSSTVGDVPEWTESQNNVLVQSGIFNTILGKINPLTIPFDKPYFLGLKVGNEPEMDPRIELTATPYSLIAKNVQNNSISTDKIQANAITIDKIVSPLISSINGVSNDGGNINLVAGNNISLLPDNINKTITISASNGGTGTGSITSLSEGNGISITNASGPFPLIGVKPNLLLGPSGSLGILNPNGAAVSSLSSINQGGFLSLSNSDLINTFGVIGSTLDRQPLLYLNNRLGNQVAELMVDEFSSGMLTLKSVLNNPTIQLKANDNAGGLINVFNQAGNTAARLTSTASGNGNLSLFSNANLKVLDLKTNSGGGGFFELFNEEGTSSVWATTTTSRSGTFGINNSFGNNTIVIKSNQFSDGEMTTYSVLKNPTVRITANDFGGGLVNVFNPQGEVAVRVVGNESGFMGIYNREKTEMIQLGIMDNQNARITVNNRLGNPSADLFSNEFSDGELTLRSVLNNPTLRLSANDNGGGLINVFSKNNNLASSLTELNDEGDFRIFNKEKVDIISMKSFLGDGSITLKNKPGFEAAGMNGSSLGGFIYVADGARTNGLNLRGVLNGGVGGGELELYNIEGTKTINLTTNFNREGLLQIRSKSDKTKRRLELGSNTNESGFLTIYNPTGNPIAQLADFNTGGNMKLFNKDSQLIHNLAVKTSGEGIYEIKSKNNNSEDVIEMGGTIDSEGYMHLFNSRSKAMISLYSSGGDGTIALSNKLGDQEALLEGSQFGGRLALHNAASKLVHEMTTNPVNQEGRYSVRSKTDQEKKRLELGGDNLGNGYLNLFNNKGFNTFFIGHNEFADGHIELRNNLGNLGGYFTAFRDGGSLAVTDGKPGTNHRVLLDGNTFGGRTTIFNNSNLMTHESKVQQNGEGILRIVNPNEITKSRVEIGGNIAKHGFIQNFNSNGLNTADIGHFDDGRGRIEVGHNNGIKVARMTANTDGSGYIGVDNTDKNEVVRLTANTAKGGGIGVKNALNKDIFNITQNQNHGVLQVHNAAGNNTGAIYNFEDGRGVIEVGHNNGTKVARMTANNDGSGYIGIDNVDKKEVVRITANNGKGGGIGIRNNLSNDIINLTQTNSSGTILVNNASGNNLATITNNTSNGGFIGTKDQNGKDAVWLGTNEKGGGNLITHNDQGKIISKLDMDAISQGRITVHGSGGNEIVNIGGLSTGDGTVKINNNTGKIIAGFASQQGNSSGYAFVNDGTGKEMARMTTTTSGSSGRVSIDNSAGFNIAGLSSSNGAGYIFTADGSGKETAIMTSTAQGNGNVSVFNKTGANLAGITMGNASGGGYVYANQSNGKDVARMSSLSSGGGYVSIDNNAEKSVSYLTSNTFNGGYIGVANASGNDRARISTNPAGAGFISISNTKGSEIATVSNTGSDHGFIQTFNASGGNTSNIGTTSDGRGIVTINDAAGNDRAVLVNQSYGGELQLKSPTGKSKARMNGAGVLEIIAEDGAYLNISEFGGPQLSIVDKFQHPRAFVKSGTILANGPNGVEHSFMASTSAGANFGYIGVCNSNIVGSPVKAGMYTNTSNQGVLFADVKNFKMDYPGKPDKQIWYGSLEGPELAAYIRGTGKIENGKATIQFPDHYVQVANAGTMTVIVTPLSGKSKGLAVVKKTNTNFSVEELMDGNGTYDFDWEVKCVRKGHEGFEVVRNKSDEPKPLIESTTTPSNITTGSDRTNISPLIKEVISPILNTKNQ